MPTSNKKSPTKRKSSESTSPSGGSSSRKKKADEATKTKKTHVSATASSAGAEQVIGPVIALPPARTLIVDNGGDTLKYGWMGDGLAPSIVPNISARVMHQFTTLVGDELGKIQNPNNLYSRQRSTERGIITNLENQTRVWKRMLDLLNVTGVPSTTEAAECLGWKVQRSKKKKSGIAAAVASEKLSAEEEAATNTAIPIQTIAVLLLLPPSCPRVVLEQILHVWMEDFGVAHVGFAVSTTCAGYDQTQRTLLKTSCTVDMGFSSTLVVPMFKNQIIKQEAVRRLPLGGRHMVNMLKYYMSYRQYNLMDQDVIMRDVFERLSYVSLDFHAELKAANMKPTGRRLYDRDFILPDYQRTFRGEIRIPPQLQRDLEREAKRKEQERNKLFEGQGGDVNEEDDDDDDDEEDEDFEADENDDDDDDDFGGDDENLATVVAEPQRVGESGEGSTTKSENKRKKSRKKASRSGDVDDADDEEIEEDEEEESLDARRKRMLQQRAEEERRRRQQEEEEQVLRVSIERFSVPEVLFRPLDAGIQPDMVGICQSIVQSVQACPMAYRPALYKTIYLVGGVSCLPNIKERLEQDLRSLIPSEYEMSISLAASPIDRAWYGANSIFSKIPYTEWSISRQEWESFAKLVANGRAKQNSSYSKLLSSEKQGYYF